MSTDETRRVIEEMVDGLNDHRIADIGEFFTVYFRWMGTRLLQWVAGIQTTGKNLFRLP